MDKSLLDTDILSEIFRGKNQSVMARAHAYRVMFGRYTISVASVMEVVRGLCLKDAYSQLKTVLARLDGEERLPFTSQDAELAGRIDAALQRVGRTIGKADPMIAATAIHHDLTLITGNLEHFKRIADVGFPLRLDNWRE